MSWLPLIGMKTYLFLYMHCWGMVAYLGSNIVKNCRILTVDSLLQLYKLLLNIVSSNIYDTRSWLGYPPSNILVVIDTPELMLWPLVECTLAAPRYSQCTSFGGVAISWLLFKASSVFQDCEFSTKESRYSHTVSKFLLKNSQLHIVSMNCLVTVFKPR